MKFLFLGNLASPYSINCNSIIDAVDWFYMDADGIAVGFRPEFILIRGIKVARMRTVIKGDNSSVSDGIVYVIPSNGMRAIKKLIR